MTLVKDGFATLQPGETMIGTDEGNLVNTAMEGREAMIAYPGTGMRTLVRIMRNTTGGTLAAGEFVLPDPTGTIAVLGQASAKSSGNEPDALVVDPTLIGTVADDDLFLAHVKGPSKVKVPAAGLTIAAAGTPLTAGASGRAAAGSAANAVTLEQLRVWDAMQTTIGTAAADDLGLVTGTLGTSVPTVQSGDAKAATVTRYAGFNYKVPDDYVAGAPLNIVINAGMLTTISDTTALLDVVAYRHAAPTVDICATAEQSINSLTAASKTFALTTTNVVPGELLLVRVSVAIVDAATATAVIGKINSIAVTPTVSSASGAIGRFVKAETVGANGLTEVILR